MFDVNAPDDLNADALLRHVRHLSVTIGPRRPASEGERAAADYVHDTIRQINERWEVINQPFRSVDGLRYRLAPLAALAGLSLLAGLRRRRQTQVVTGLFCIGLSVVSRDAFLARSLIWETWVPRGESQNVIVRIAPRRRAQRRVVFLAHLDSGVHRLSTDPRAVRHLPYTLGGITLMALVGGVLSVLAGKKGRWRGLRALIGMAALGAAGLAIADETGPEVCGAIGNASGVAVLLGMAQTLAAQPLESTEVVLAFTGSGTATATGADMLATAYGEAWRDALWVVVNNVGAGELCWATRHGISPYAYYYPHPDAVRVMERVAEARPDLGLMGKPMLSLDEVALLRDRDLRAVALVGYDRVTGLIPHWRRASDTIHVLTPGTVERAAHACWTITRVLDESDIWPVRQ
ncbi:MAG: hypothetical protein Kow00106_24410 [Anaerolineae bacterium]